MKFDGAKPDSTAARTLGRDGEALAAHFLRGLGWEIVATNVTLPIGRSAATGRLVTGELDIVALDGETLVFVEVKTRRDDDLAAPEAAVTPGKQRRLRRAARRYRSLIGPLEAAYRFDVIGIVWSEGRAPRIRHVKGFLGPELDRR